jgi:hypothetical protein
MVFSPTKGREAPGGEGPEAALTQRVLCISAPAMWPPPLRNAFVVSGLGLPGRWGIPAMGGASLHRLRKGLDPQLVHDPPAEGHACFTVG